MAETNTPIPDLVELDGLAENTSYSVGGSGGGTILGVVDDATYSDSSNKNINSDIVEIYETADGRSGTLNIGGTEYAFSLISSENSGNGGDVIVAVSGGGSTKITGDRDDSDVVFIVATPVGGDASRYFALFDDNFGDVGPISAITTRTFGASAGNDHNINADQDKSVEIVCFVAGTLIDTPNGCRRIEDIAVGDLVTTADRGARPVVWCCRNHVSAETLTDGSKWAPIFISEGALGPGVPNTPLRVSPQHRVMLRSKIANRLFSAPEVLVRAKKLVGLDGIWQETPERDVDYHHILCKRHEVVFCQLNSCRDALARQTGACQSAFLQRAMPSE